MIELIKEARQLKVPCFFVLRASFTGINSWRIAKIESSLSGIKILLLPVFFVVLSFLTANCTAINNSICYF
jgi:hypothetical protein